MATLMAGLSVVDITPTDFPGIRLGGFGLNRRARGILHPLEAGILYLAVGNEYVVIVTVDSVGIGLPWVDRIRDAVTALPQRDRILISASHAHSVPDTLGYWGKSLLFVLPRTCGIDPRYMHFLTARIAGGIDEAVANARPAELSAARFEIPPGLVVNHRKGGALDPQGHVLCLRDESGAKLGCLVNLACHPEGLWDKNRLVSPDFPHFTRGVVRDHGWGKALFANGALGGMLTLDIPKKTSTLERQGEVERIGRALGDLAATAAHAAQPVAVERLQLVSTAIHLPFVNWKLRLVERLKVISRSQTDGTVRTEMHLARLTSETGAPLVQFLSVPGEPLPELGQAFRRVLQHEPSLILALCCDELGYLLPPEQVANPEYSYEASMSPGPETGPILVEAATKLVEAPADARWV